MDIELIEATLTEISEYNATEAGLAELRTRMENVEYDVITVKGMALAKADRAEVRGLRTGLEAMRKTIKAPALAHCKLIDDEAKRITAALLELETPINAQIKARELALEIERAAREQAERERITDIHRRITEIRGYQSLANGRRTAAAVGVLMDKLAKIDITGFEEFQDEANTAIAETIDWMDKTHTQMFANEAVRARFQAEQDADATELAKARAELDAAKAEQDRLSKANRDAAIVEADRLATERQAQEDAAAALNQAALADIQRQRDEFSAEHAKALAESAAIKQQLAFERRLVDEQKLATSTVLIAPLSIDDVANELTFQPGAAEWLSSLTVEDMAGVVDVVFGDTYYKTTPPTSSDIYAMCTESDTADQFAKWLCEMAGVAFPPINEGVSA